MPWWRRHPKLIVTLFVIVLAAAGGVAYALQPSAPAPVYVTDGAHVFNADLRSVENLVRRQNTWVTGTGKRYVNIAVVVGPDSRRAVEGAYLAQYETNHPTGPNGEPGASLVRLLLADDSAGQRTVAALADQHVVAVTGLGSGDADLARALAGRHIAMVGTGDLTGISGLVRVTPTYADEVRAAIRFLGGDPDPHHPLPARPRMWLMQDENDADGYAIALGDAYPPALRAAAGRSYQVIGPGSEYDSSVPAAATVLAASATAGGDGVCHAHVNVVYFAGTGADLPATLAKLGHRSCARSQPLTVLTGSDAAQVVGHADLWPAATANMDVYFTALASPGMWGNRSTPADPAWFEQKAYGFPHMFPTEAADALDDGQAIVSHDAVLTAIEAARGAAPSAVAARLTRVSVHGASGYLCFDKAGDPVDKAIPIVQLSASGALTYRGVAPGPVTRC
jgi:hypothetical protein